MFNVPFLRSDEVSRQIAALNERPAKLEHLPIYGEKIRVFRTAGLFLGVVVDGVVDKIFGPRCALNSIGIPIHDPSSTQIYIRDYSMSHMPPETPRSKGPICIDVYEVVFLETL